MDTESSVLDYLEVRPGQVLSDAPEPRGLTAEQIFQLERKLNPIYIVVSMHSGGELHLYVSSEDALKLSRAKKAQSSSGWTNIEVRNLASLRGEDYDRMVMVDISTVGYIDRPVKPLGVE